MVEALRRDVRRIRHQLWFTFIVLFLGALLSSVAFTMLLSRWHDQSVRSRDELCHGLNDTRRDIRQIPRDFTDLAPIQRLQPTIDKIDRRMRDYDCNKIKLGVIGGRQ